MSLLQESPALLEGFKRGDRKALETIYRAYFDDVARILRLGFVTGREAKTRVPGLSEDAALRDAIQEAFTRAFKPEARLSYDPSRPYRPFLLQIVRNMRLDELRTRKREVVASTLGPAHAPLDLDQIIELNLAIAEEVIDDPQARREWDALTARTSIFVSSLDAQAQRFVELRFKQSLSQADVADALSVTRRHVRTLEAQILADLKRFLGR